MAAPLLATNYVIVSVTLYYLLLYSVLIEIEEGFLFKFILK